MAKQPAKAKAKAKEQPLEDCQVSTTVNSQQPGVTTTSSENRKATMSEQRTMIEYSEDISNAEAPPPLPASDYPAEIRSAEIKTSDKGNDYLSIGFYISPDAYPADYTEGNPDGMTLMYNRVQVQDTQQGRYRMRKFLEAVGASTGRSVDVNQLVGLTATVTIKHGTWEGETRAEISKVAGS